MRQVSLVLVQEVLVRRPEVPMGAPAKIRLHVLVRGVLPQKSSDAVQTVDNRPTLEEVVRDPAQVGLSRIGTPGADGEDPSGVLFTQLDEVREGSAIGGVAQASAEDERQKQRNRGTSQQGG